MSAEERIAFGAAAIPEPERDWLAAVERLPIDSVWQGGHVLPPSSTGEAVTRLALMTAWTERVRVGTAVLVLPLYHPVVVAKQLADLDVRSGGRVCVGVGVGGEFAKEFQAVGVPRAERGWRTDESIEVLRALWRGGAVSFHGRFVDFEDVELLPVAGPEGTSGTRRSGGPPIVVSGRKEAAMRRAARLGDGFMPYLLSAGAYARARMTVEQCALAEGRDLRAFEWMLYLYTSIRRRSDEARSDVANFLGRAYGARPEMLEHIAPAGTPDEVAERVQEYVDAGARHIIVSPAATHDTLEVVRLAAEEVLPRLSIPVQAP
ncbi:MAG TPA: LLM class flavin-dependent oxidoreductase [Acidimicrobiales bacterium]|nr:LLM class flavin-dependent oxidoreductase [Acidimicrobiales bacterium]